MNETWWNDTLNGEYKDDAVYNFSHVLWRCLKHWEAGEFEGLAGEGGLVHSPLGDA